MASFLDKLKEPSFWISIIGMVGAVGAGLTDTGNPQLIAIGAILTGVYTLADHLKDAVVQGTKNTATGKVESATITAAAVLPPFYQSDAQHPATNVVLAPAPAPVPTPAAAPAQGVAPSIVADQQAQINDVQKQIADLHAKLVASA